MDNWSGLGVREEGDIGKRCREPVSCEGVTTTCCDAAGWCCRTEEFASCNTSYRVSATAVPAFKCRAVQCSPQMGTCTSLYTAPRTELQVQSSNKIGICICIRMKKKNAPACGNSTASLPIGRGYSGAWFLIQPSPPPNDAFSLAQPSARGGLLGFSLY